MRRLDRRAFAALSFLTALFLTSCDWESGSQNNFNTSGGSANVNISGVYRGIDGGRIVLNTSNGNISFLTIQQSGNTVSVTDNQGSTYEGTIGAPLVSGVDNGTGTIQAGANVASYQISFTGRDGVSGRDIEFTGVITLVTVSEVEADVSTTDRVTETVTSSNTVLPPTDPADTGSGTTIDTTDTVTRTVTPVTYSITRNNNQLELNGTWVELGGVVSGVRGLGPAAQGNVVVTTL